MEDDEVATTYAVSPWHRLYFLPLPHGQGSLRPIFFKPLPAPVARRAEAPAAIAGLVAIAVAAPRDARRRAEPAGFAASLWAGTTW